jgi:serine/threonine-protein kinase HipA
LKSLDVYYEGWGERWHLGGLAQSADGNIDFNYTFEAFTQNLELSPLNLPLGEESFAFRREQQFLPGLLADSLPDGWGMLLMDRYCRKNGIEVDEVSSLDRLALLGDRTMGALTYTPAQGMTKSTASFDVFHLAQQAQDVMRGKDSELFYQLFAAGVAPHGARPKILVDYNESTGDMGVQRVENGRPWLLKFQLLGEHKEVCAIENSYAALARDCGLAIPATRYFDLSPRLGAFGVARFDVENGSRVPVHTLAGITGADFRVPGALSYADFLQVTRELTRDGHEVEKAFARAVFNVVFNNRDDHPKNISFRLNRERQWKLSPAYDLTFAPGPGGYHQMDVMGEAMAVTRKHMIELATSAGISTHKAKEHIDRHLAIAGGFAKAFAAVDVRPATVRSMVAQVKANAERLR